VVLAPSHRCAFRGLSVGSYGKFATPLGDIPVDTEACSRLLEADELFVQRNDAHIHEHSLEVQLPFLQRVLGGGFKLVPVVVGAINAQDARKAGEVLGGTLWGDGHFWVVSTDFTHYGDAFGYTPFTDDVENRLKELDHGAIRQIEAKDFAGFVNYVDGTGATICGRLPVAVLLAAVNAASPAAECSLLGYTTSGRMTRDFSHSVSYVAMAVTEGGSQPEKSGAVPEQLGGRDRKTLLSLAREAIRTRLEGGELTLPDTSGMGPMLKEEGAAFVTLHLNGRLRGCIGNILPEEELYLNVMHNAVNAAFRDPRFNALTAEEFDKSDIEISVLTKPRRIPSLDDFVIGRHGIILSKKGRRAVFLPQVAAEQGWNVETTMTHLALKAGLRADDWKRDATYEVFEAIVFHE
jgi:hypothetical protein